MLTAPYDGRVTLLHKAHHAVSLNTVAGIELLICAGAYEAAILGGGFVFKMFSLPAAALAIYDCAKPENKARVAGIMGSAALTSFLTGITEPLEFAFLFVAPLLHAAETKAAMAG